MKINVDIQNGQLIAENVQAEQVNKVIDGFFNVLGFDTKREPVAKKITPVVTKNEEKNTESEPKTTPKAQTVQNPPKILPKVNGDWTLNVPISEILESKQQIPEHWKTGVINRDDKLHYRTKYWCDCGNEGKRYIPKDTKFVYCHECNQKLLVEPATLEFNDNGLPERDQWGNFYIAREAYEEGE